MKPATTCHKCTGSLQGLPAHKKASCPTCLCSYHNSDCGYRYKIASACGQKLAALSECPKCTRTCACEGGPVSCRIELRQKRRKTGDQAAHPPPQATGPGTDSEGSATDLYVPGAQSSSDYLTKVSETLDATSPCPLPVLDRALKQPEARGAPGPCPPALCEDPIILSNEDVARLLAEIRRLRQRNLQLEAEVSFLRAERRQWCPELAPPQQQDPRSTAENLYGLTSQPGPLLAGDQLRGYCSEDVCQTQTPDAGQPAGGAAGGGGVFLCGAGQFRVHPSLCGAAEAGAGTGSASSSSSLGPLQPLEVSEMEWPPDFEHFLAACIADDVAKQQAGVERSGGGRPRDPSGPEVRGIALVENCSAAADSAYTQIKLFVLESFAPKFFLFLVMVGILMNIIFGDDPLPKKIRHLSPERLAMVCLCFLAPIICGYYHILKAVFTFFSEQRPAFFMCGRTQSDGPVSLDEVKQVGVEEALGHAKRPLSLQRRL